MDGNSVFDNRARWVEAPDGRFWHVYSRPWLLSAIVEASTEALPCERLRWRVAGLASGRAAALQVARALRTGADLTPDGGVLISHTVAARVMPPTGNVTLV